MISGIYRIVNTVTNRTYIGSSVNVDRRLKAHADDLSKLRHGNKHLLASWIKHGGQVFNFEQLIDCNRIDLAEREQQFMDAYLEHGLPLFNQRPSAESQRGFRWEFTAEHRANIGKASTGRFFSEESRAKMSAKRKGRPAKNKGIKLSKEVRARISASLTGKRFSPEHRAKIGTATKSRSPEFIAQIAASRRGYKHSAETRAKLSVLAKARSINARKYSPETMEKMWSVTDKFIRPSEPAQLVLPGSSRWCRRLGSDARARISASAKGNTRWVGRKHSLESRTKMRNARIGHKHSVASRIKMSTAHTGKPFTMAHRAKLKEAITASWILRKARAEAPR